MARTSGGKIFSGGTPSSSAVAPVANMGYGKGKGKGKANPIRRGFGLGTATLKRHRKVSAASIRAYQHELANAT